MSNSDDDIDDVNESVKKGAQKAKKKVEDFGSEAESTWDDGVRKVKRAAREFGGGDSQSAIDKMRDRVEDYAERGQKLSKEYPLYALLGAAAIGMLAGMVIVNSAKD